MSGVILLIGALAIGGKGLNFGIDFESGTRITTGARAGRRPRTHVRNGDVSAGLRRRQDPEGQQQGARRATSSRSPRRRWGRARSQQVRAALDQRFGVGNNFSNDSIGPTFGQTVAKSAIIAIIASLLVISIYIALRFEWKYAVPVLIALMHDLLITAGVYSLTGREVTTSTVAALLTILGYSLYDTIIVFDRVRENVPRMPRAAFSRSSTARCPRSWRDRWPPSFCTLLPVLALLLFGGETLQDFAFALLVGIASGAYSSIFIASPVLTHWKERERVYVPAHRAHPRASPAASSPPTPWRRSAASPSRSSRRRQAAPTSRGAGAGGRLTDARGARGDLRARSSTISWPTSTSSASRGARARAARRAAEPARRRRRAAPSARRARPRRRPAEEGQGPKPKRPAQPPPREESLMGHARLGDDGPRPLALHDLAPRPLLGRDRRRLRRRADRRDHLRLSSTAARVPGEADTHLLTALEAIPGALIGMAAVVPRGHAARGAEPHRAGPSRARRRADGAVPSGARPTVAACLPLAPTPASRSLPAESARRPGCAPSWACSDVLAQVLVRRGLAEPAAAQAFLAAEETHPPGRSTGSSAPSRRSCATRARAGASSSTATTTSTA